MKIFRHHAEIVDAGAPAASAKLTFRSAKAIRLAVGLVFIAMFSGGCAKFQRHSHVFVVAIGPDTAYGPARSNRLEGGTIILYSQDGKALAKLAYGGYQTFYLSEPAQYSCLAVVDGHMEPLRGPEWQQCARKQGLWTTQWIEQAASAEVTLTGCPPLRQHVRWKKHEDSRIGIWVPWRGMWSDTLSTTYLGTLRLGRNPCEFDLE